jgi:hypothetical protein
LTGLKLPGATEGMSGSHVTSFLTSRPSEVHSSLQLDLSQHPAQHPCVDPPVCVMHSHAPAGKLVVSLSRAASKDTSLISAQCTAALHLRVGRLSST